MLKKVYLEITNTCNLDCSFCIKNKRDSLFLSEENFDIILDKLKKYTNYLYFHVLGEPLMHPKVNKFIDKAYNNNFNVNITTNGYLIDRLKTNNIRQINISLHSFDKKYNISINDYMFNIFNKIDSLNNTYISLRLWVNNSNTKEIIDLINKHYNLNINYLDINSTIKINDYIFINTFHEFIWPDLNNNYYDSNGTCYALTDHIGILSDGIVIPCCLDSQGIINLGNIYNDNLSDILNSDKVLKMIDGFKNNKKCEELCKHCKFLDK